MGESYEIECWFYALRKKKQYTFSISLFWLPFPVGPIFISGRYEKNLIGSVVTFGFTLVFVVGWSLMYQQRAHLPTNLRPCCPLK